VGAVVVSVDYRLAPDHSFPVVVKDVVEAVLYLSEHAEELGLDVYNFALSGFSAGGNMAFSVPLVYTPRYKHRRKAKMLIPIVYTVEAKSTGK
jgi:acetyl esterase/lipase